MSRAYIVATKPTGNPTLVFKTPPDSLEPKISSVTLTSTDTPNGTGADTFETTSGAVELSIKARDVTHTLYLEDDTGEYITLFPGQSYNISHKSGLPNIEFTFYSSDSGCIAEIFEWF